MTDVHREACVRAVEEIAQRLGLEIVNEASEVRPASMNYVKPSELASRVPAAAGGALRGAAPAEPDPFGDLAFCDALEADAAHLEALGADPGPTPEGPWRLSLDAGSSGR